MECLGGVPGGVSLIVTRFAPSPTGFLHLGHACAALTARAVGERMWLRLEDIDAGRCRPEYADAVLEDLAWLGVAWDGAVRRQSEHIEEYRAVLEGLRGRELLYPCFCTRAAVAREVAAMAGAPHGPDGPLYPGTCRRLPPGVAAARIATGEAYAWRLDMARAVAVAPGKLSYVERGEGVVPAAPEAFGDVVLGRKDTPASYHLCVTHDDALQGVTLVTRGADLRPATGLHRLLQALCGWPAPHYAHHRLLTDTAGRRLAKRDGAASLRALRAAGHDPADVRRMAWNEG